MSDVADEIDQVRFTPVRIRQGYDMDGVDNLLDALSTAARDGSPLAPVVETARVGFSRLREGYDMDEVDAFLTRTTGRTLVRPTPSSATTPPSAVQEVRGPIARLRGLFRSQR